MKNFNKNGFTLIEIIVVLIIIGILAAIALPNLFANVQKSKASSAIATMDGFKNQLEACAFQNNTQPGGAACPVPLAVDDNGYHYTIWPFNTLIPQSATSGTQLPLSGSPSGNNLSYAILASDGSGNVIVLNRQTNGSFFCSAPSSGAYAGVC